MSDSSLEFIISSKSSSLSDWTSSSLHGFVWISTLVLVVASASKEMVRGLLLSNLELLIWRSSYSIFVSNLLYFEIIIIKFILF